MSWHSQADARKVPGFQSEAISGRPDVMPAENCKLSVPLHKSEAAPEAQVQVLCGQQLRKARLRLTEV